MMSLSEAIKHAEEKANDENCCCRAECAQLAEWLKELALRRSVSFNMSMYDSFYGNVRDFQNNGYMHNNVY